MHSIYLIYGIRSEIDVRTQCSLHWYLLYLCIRDCLFYFQYAISPIKWCYIFVKEKEKQSKQKSVLYG